MKNKLLIGCFLMTAMSISAQNITHRVAVEEFTGTGCGYCPRGWQGMENLREWYGDQFVGIALHQFNENDPMYIESSKYKNLMFTGAPECRVERGTTEDPYDGIKDVFERALKKSISVGVDVEGVWNNDKTQVEAIATVNSTKSSIYNIEFVLIGDDVHSPDVAWRQHNYYYSEDPANEDAGLAKFCKGGELGQEYLYDLHFNDVALSSSYSNSRNAAELGRVVAGTPAQSTFTLSMPTSETLLSGLNYDKIYVVALVTNRLGHIVNAAKSLVVDKTASSVENIVKPGNNTPVMHFSANGQRVNINHKGLTIIRMADGTVKKIIK